MDDADRLEAKGLARAKIRARRRRVQTIRRRTVRGSVALFAVIWAVVFAQLVGGKDPALGSGAPVAERRTAAAEAPRPSPETELAQVPELELEEEEEDGEAEFEAEPEPELEPEPEPELEPEPEPEPEPIVTSSS
jgi:outer membrane biosynthesis protein TonB